VLEEHLEEMSTSIAGQLEQEQVVEGAEEPPSFFEAPHARTPGSKQMPPVVPVCTRR